MKCKPWTENISLNLLDINQAIDFKNLKNYLDSKRGLYHKNIENPNKKEFHYSCSDSVIFITELPGKADIKIVAPRYASLERMKSKIEDILNRV